MAKHARILAKGPSIYKAHKEDDSVSLRWTPADLDQLHVEVLQKLNPLDVIQPASHACTCKLSFLWTKISFSDGIKSANV